MNKIIPLLFVLFFCTSCKQENQPPSNNIRDEIAVESDSLYISLQIPAQKSTGLNVWLKPYDEFYLEFKNKSDKDSIMTKKIPLLYDYYQMNFGTFKYDLNRKLKIIYKNFLASQEKTDIELKLDSNLIEYRNKTSLTILTDSIYDSYENLRIKHFENKTLESEDHVKELDSLRDFFKKLTYNQEANSRINEMLYLDEIQKINPKDKRVEEFLKNSDAIMTGGAQVGILFNYFKNNVELLDYDNLNTKKNSETYIELLSIGAYRFLKFQDNKGDAKYNKVVDWLKTTDFYKRDSTHIRKEITPLNNEKFKEVLNGIELVDLNDRKTKMFEIISKNNSKYYLIDFWATWCAPCIQGAKTINEMSIPKNVKVLSFSVDKEKDKEKWKSKTIELEQKCTYWFNEKSQINKEFIQFIEMQSIPRYMLIDKNMNLIDQAFYQPHELQFLSKLKALKTININK